ncbi:hypothetical protein E3P99_01436 [Wallemia hederae]|uniref:Uncharacterized protein n=1 Tax=Wallemia hederae TaxID=1540922 RepID=A0A4T0FSP7_9BASI|nr:hypothetical protein E3P99_01436 [Wallemia hederae]
MINYIHFIKYPRISNNRIIFSVYTANDLRTEPGTEPVSINLAILVHTRKIKPIRIDGAIQSNKVIELAMSHYGLLPSDSFTLLFYAKNSSIKPEIADVLHSPHPLPLQSLPIPSKDAVHSQQRSFTVNAKQLHILEHCSFDLDKKLWDSGLALSAELCSSLGSYINPSKPLNVLELGTDLDTAIPLLSKNIKRNAHLYENIQLRAEELSWGESSPVENAPYDVVIAADITYNTSSFSLLSKTLESIFNANPSTRLILAHKYRDQQEETFWEYTKELKLTSTHLKTVGRGRRGYETEIWEFKREQ